MSPSTNRPGNQAFRFAPRHLPIRIYTTCVARGRALSFNHRAVSSVLYDSHIDKQTVMPLYNVPLGSSVPLEFAAVVQHFSKHLLQIATLETEFTYCSTSSHACSDDPRPNKSMFYIASFNSLRLCCATLHSRSQDFPVLLRLFVIGAARPVHTLVESLRCTVQYRAVSCRAEMLCVSHVVALTRREIYRHHKLFCFSLPDT